MGIWYKNKPEIRSAMVNDPVLLRSLPIITLTKTKVDTMSNMIKTTGTSL
jgi:hypothetical protein